MPRHGISCLVSCRRNDLLFSMEDTVKGWQDDKSEKRTADDAAHHHSRERALHFRSRSRVECHGDEAKRGYKCGHEHRSQAGHRPFEDGMVEGMALFSHLFDE